MWNPPLIDEATGTRRSAPGRGGRPARRARLAGVRTICFLAAARGIELIQRFARDNLERRGKPELADADRPLPRRLHAAAAARDRGRPRRGELLAVVATDALELGIDVGELDAAICVTFPGTVASLRQMWGRAGRRRRGLAVYVAGQDALDQFFCRHPEEFLERPVEAAILDHANEQIAARHLIAAAYELPLTDADDEFFGDGWRERAERLLAAGELRRAGGQLLPAAQRLRRRADLAALGLGRLGRGDRARLGRDARPGRGRARLHDDPPGRGLPPPRALLRGRAARRRRRAGAVVHAFDGDWYTRPKKETEIYIEQDRRRAARGRRASQLNFGEVSVTEQVIAFQRVSISDQEPIDIVALELPEQNFVTQALWYVLPSRLTAALPPDVLLGALHATEHGQIAVLPLIAMCDRWDIGGLSTNVHFQTGRSTIFIYDGHPGGVGITKRGYEEFERLLGDAERLIAECPCESGCPSCVQSPKCGNLNEPLHKAGALELMGLMATEAGGRRVAMARARQVSVIGAPRRSEGSELWALAEEVGRLLAEAGVVIVCGGIGGVMEAASRGAAGPAAS